MHAVVTPRTLRARDRELDLSRGPLLMGIVNVTPDSFSDGGELPALADQLRRAHELRDQGADILDIGGESAITIAPPVPAAEEIERVCPLVEALAGKLDIAISVDTYKAEVARAVLAAGAAMINDPSGLRDPELAGACGEAGAALVVTHTRAAPKQKLVDPRYDDVVDDIVALVEDRIAIAEARGVSRGGLVVDPGPDMAKTPAQSVEALRRLDEVRRLGLPLLLAVSRKDFVGALTRKAPRDRLAGTLAAVGHGVDHGADILRVHDVGEVRDFLAVRAALGGEAEVAKDLALPDELRWQGAQEREKAPDHRGLSH